MSNTDSSRREREIGLCFFLRGRGGQDATTARPTSRLFRHSRCPLPVWEDRLRRDPAKGCDSSKRAALAELNGMFEDRRATGPRRETAPFNRQYLCQTRFGDNLRHVYFVVNSH